MHLIYETQGKVRDSCSLPLGISHVRSSHKLSSSQTNPQRVIMSFWLLNKGRNKNLYLSFVRRNEIKNKFGNQKSEIKSQITLFYIIFVGQCHIHVQLLCCPVTYKKW